MRPRAWLAGLLLGAALAGCKGTSAATYPPDPLFVNRKPVEVRPENAPPVKVAYNEPAAPSRLDNVAGGRVPGRPTTAEPPLGPVPPVRPAAQRTVTATKSDASQAAGS